MIHVTLVGNGNLAHHLSQVFNASKAVKLVAVLPSREEQLIKALNDEKIERSDIFIIAVSDNAITSVSEHFIKYKKLIVHTSGGSSIDVLPEAACKGVFYPLQTFSKEREVDFKSIPICLEAGNSKDVNLLKELAGQISNSVYEVDSAKRKQLHLAAVYVNNFVNQLYHVGQEICNENGLSFDLLKPLIKETAKKIENLLPEKAQTGPAKRNDQTTIEVHLSQLKNNTHKDIYKLLTKSIQQTHGKKL